MSHGEIKKIKEMKAEYDQNNPCLKERQLSMKCLEENGYDRDKCEHCFENYRNCRKFWSWVQNSRKREGILPHLPNPEEREEVKQKYLSVFNKGL